MSETEYPNQIRMERDDLRVRVRELEAEAKRLKIQSDGWQDECFLAVKQRDEAIAELAESRKMHRDLRWSGR